MRSARTFGVCIILLSIFAMGQSVSPIATIEQPLVPTAAQPGGAGFTLTISGTGFVAPTGVLFGGTQLSITNSTASQLTATVLPANIAAAGTASVSVLSGDGLVSNVQFFQIATPASPQFAAPVDYSPGGEGTTISIQSALVADFNGDGILDLAIGFYYPVTGPQVAILLGNSDGTFQTPTAYNVDDATSIVAGRFTNDGGSIDLVAGDTLLKNNGSGVFTTTSLGVQGFRPFAVGDFSQTGVLDIAGAVGVNVQILNNNGEGQFTAGQSFTGGTTQFGGMLAADFNGDGILDLAVLDTYPMAPVVRVFLGAAGTAGFNSEKPLTTSTPAGVEAFTAADFNGDQKQDLALVYNPSGGQVLVLNGNGDGTFTNGFSAALENSVSGAIVTADFNEDGKLDLATGTYILQGNGDGTFQKPISFGGTAQVLATGDFNGDGRPDLAAESLSDVAILLQQAPTSAPTVSLAPNSLTFSSQTAGTTSASQLITLSNTGNGVLDIDSITITGTNAGEFSQTNSCGNSLAATASCTINVTFAPTAPGTAIASVSIADNAAGNPQTVSLSGLGVAPTGAPVVSLAPMSLTFNTLAVGSTSPSQQITLSNTGNAALDIGSIGITGTNTGEFSQTNNCGESLAATASCTINVTFAPTDVGTATASVSISDRVAGSPQTVSLTGTGAPFSLTTTCTSLTVVPGQTAIYTVDLVAAGESTPSVSLSCSGAPALATCTVSPTSMTLNGSASVQAQVTATTTQATGSLRSPFAHSSENRLAGLVGFGGTTGLAALMIILPGRRRKKPARRLCGLIFLFCTLATVTTLPSCGGRADPPGTVAGTYSLTVTGTFQQPSGAPITETVSFNLVVQ